MTKKRNSCSEYSEQETKPENSISGEVNEIEIGDHSPIITDPLQPASLELRYGDKDNKVPEKLTKERVESSVRRKLAKKTDDNREDPFVPQAQLDNEIVQVAREKGFPLSRGTEIGARLLARSKRKD